MFVKAFKQVTGVYIGVDIGSITIDHYAKAVASFERTIVAGNSPFDRYLYGVDKSAMSEAAVRGLEGYLGQARCVSCDQCNPNASNTHRETYPKFQQQLGKVAVLSEMINWCIENPLESTHWH